MSNANRPASPEAAAGSRTTGVKPAAEVFADLALELHGADSVEETVDGVLRFALQAISCDRASVVFAGRRPEIVAVTDPALAELFQVQIEANAGPLVGAIQDGELVSVPDVLADTRWSPDWAEQAAAAGIRAALHVPLTANGRPAGVLSLFRCEPEPFTDDDVAVAHILARHAAVAITSARKAANLVTAVDARKIVGQAMGILMERYNLDSDRSFEVLRRYSQDTNRKLRDIAQELIDTRELPSRPG